MSGERAKPGNRQVHERLARGMSARVGGVPEKSLPAQRVVFTGGTRTTGTDPPSRIPWIIPTVAEYSTKPCWVSTQT